MNKAKKQHIKRILNDAIRDLSEVLGSLKEANGIIQEEIEQLYIGRLLTHKKGASDEMFELGEDKRRLRFLYEQLDTYADDLINIAAKYE